MQERVIVDAIVKGLRNLGFTVATEVANFYRSADIAVLDDDGNVSVIECKVSSMGRAIEQSKTHKLAADKVYIGTFHRNTKESTLKRIKQAGLGLIYVMPDGVVCTDVIKPGKGNPWQPARQRLLKRIMGSQQ